MKHTVLFALLATSFSYNAFADKWDDTFNEVVKHKNQVLPYDITADYRVIDVAYDKTTRTFSNIILIKSATHTADDIKKEYQTELKDFCNEPNTKASVEDNVTFKFIFQHKENDAPLLSMTIDKKACQAAQ